MANQIQFDFIAEMNKINAALDSLDTRLTRTAAAASVAMGDLLAHGIEKGIEMGVEAGKALLEDIAEFLKSSFEEALADIKVDTALATSLRNAGDAATFTTEEIKKLGLIMQDKTIFDHKEVEKTAEAFTDLGLSGDNLLNAIHAVADLSSAKGLDEMGTKAQLLARALANPERALQLFHRTAVLGESQLKALAAALDAANSSGERQAAIIDAVSTRYQGHAEAAGKAAGASAELAHEWEHIKAQVGETINDIVKDLEDGLKFELLEVGKVLLQLVKDGEAWLASWSTGMDGAKNKSEELVASLARVETKLGNIGHLAHMAAERITYVTTFGHAGYWKDPYRNNVGLSDKAIGPAAINDMRLADEAKKAKDEAFQDSLGGRATHDKPDEWEPSKELLSQIKKAVDETFKPIKEEKDFRSQTLTGTGLFDKIQNAAASEQKNVQEKQLTAQERLVKIQEEDQKKTDLTNQLLQQIKDQHADKTQAPVLGP